MQDIIDGIESSSLLTYGLWINNKHKTWPVGRHIADIFVRHFSHETEHRKDHEARQNARKRIDCTG